MCPLHQPLPVESSRLHSSHTTSMSEHMNVCVCLSVGVREGYQPEGKAAWQCDRQIRKKRVV